MFHILLFITLKNCYKNYFSKKLYPNPQFEYQESRKRIYLRKAYRNNLKILTIYGLFFLKLFFHIKKTITVIVIALKRMLWLFHSCSKRQGNSFPLAPLFCCVYTFMDNWPLSSYNLQFYQNPVLKKLRQQVRRRCPVFQTALPHSLHLRNRRTEYG